MAAQRKSTGAIIGSIFGAIGGILLFSSIGGFMDGLGRFVEALSYTQDFGIAFEAAMAYSGGRFVIGLIGVILLIIAFFSVRASAAQAARTAADKGSEIAQRAQEEAQRRAQEQQRELAQRAQQARQAAEQRAQAFRQQQAGSNSGPSRLDELRQRVATNPRMQQLRNAAEQAGYGDLVDRYVPGQPTPQQTRPHQEQRADAQPAPQQHQQPQRQSQPQQPRQPQRPTQPGQRTAQAAQQARARLVARAREAGIDTPAASQARPTTARSSALTRSSLSSASLIRTSLTTNSLFRTRRRDPLQTAQEALLEQQG